MNKIIGLISAWGAEKWIELSLLQALNICDEVIVNVGPYVENMSKFHDNTRRICDSFGSRVKVVTSIMTNAHATAKAATLNKMLEESELFEVGNWIWLFDVDEYYDNKTVVQIRERLFDPEKDYNSIELNERYFFINTTRYLKNKRMRLWKIENINHHFIPTNKWSGPRDKKLKCDDLYYFHYSLLMNQQFKKELFKTETGLLDQAQKEKMEWTDKIYMNYDLDDELHWVNENHRLYGKKQPYWRSDFTSDTDGTLFVYKERHPKLIEQAGLTNVKDFRKWL